MSKLEKSLVLLLIIPLIYTIYKSEIYNNGLLRSYYLKFYIILISSILFITLISFFKKSFKIYTYITLFSIVASLYIFEAYLILIRGENNILIKQKKYEKNYVKFDKRTRYEVFLEKNKISKKYTVNFHPSYYLNKKKSLLPLSGISNMQTINCNENGYYAEYMSDRYGFNNPDTEWNSKSISYLLIGDSFVHGSCVNRPHDLGSILRSLSKKKVINLGQRGNGPLMNYATLKEYYPKGTKNVIWFYFIGNDPIELKDEINDNLLIKYLKNKNFSQNLKNKQYQIDKNLNKTIELEIMKEHKFLSYLDSSKTKIFSFVKLYNLRKILQQSYLFYDSILPQDELKKILKMATDLSSKNDSKFYVVILPSYFKNNLSKHQTIEYELILKILNELQINYIDIVNEFKNTENHLSFFPFELPGHYNEKGYLEVGKKIFNIVNN